MVSDGMFVHNFGDLDMMVEIFFENDGATKKGGIDFEIGDMGTSAHLFRGLEFKEIFLQSLFVFFVIFW